MMDAKENVPFSERITQIRFDRHTIQFALESSGLIVAEGILEISTPDGTFIIDVKGGERKLNVLSALLDREIINMIYQKSSANFKMEGVYAVRLLPSERGGEAGLVRIGIAHADRLRDGGRHERRVGDRRELDQERAVLESRPVRPNRRRE